MVAIGKDIAEQAQYARLLLTQRAKPNTLRVRFRGAEIPGGPREEGGFWIYSYSTNEIIFHDLSFAPGEDEDVQVEYEVDDGY